MAENIFQKIQDLRSAAEIPARGPAAQDWFRQTIRNLYGDRTLVGREQLIQAEGATLVSRHPSAAIGKLYMFVYNPKHRVKLPYYDVFPMIFVLEVRTDSLLGINMHYLPYNLRLRLFNRLIELLSDDNMDENTRLRLSYRAIKTAAKFEPALSLIREYKAKYIRSQLLEVQPQDWEIAMFLPTATFHKAGRQTVWGKTRQQIIEARRKRRAAARKRQEKERAESEQRLSRIAEEERKKRKL